MSNWIRIARVDEVPEGGGREFTVGDRIVAVYQVEGEFFALDGICPHAGGPLAEGRVQGRIVTCPWHGWQFDVSTGRHCLSQAIRQESFPVKVDAGEIHVDLPDGG